MRSVDTQTRCFNALFHAAVRCIDALFHASHRRLRCFDVLLHTRCMDALFHAGGEVSIE